MISIFSLFLELLFDQIIPKELYITPLFTLVSILFIKKKNYILLFILGFIYDLFFTEIIFLHSIIFVIFGLIKKNNLFICILVITLYQIILYIFYYLFKIQIISIKELFFITSHYYILNIIYYFILSIIYKKKS